MFCVQDWSQVKHACAVGFWGLEDVEIYLDGVFLATIYLDPFIAKLKRL